MRLLFLHHSWPGAGPGGSELHLAEIASGLAARGHEVSVLAGERDRHRPDGELREANGASVRLIRLNNLGRHSSALGAFDPVAEQAVARVVKAGAPELVHAHHLSGFGVDALLAPRAAGVPLVLSLHDHWAACLLGQLVDRDLRECPGPQPARCAACASSPAARPLVRALAPAAFRLQPGWAAPFVQRQAAIRRLLRSADALVAPSESFARRIASLGFPSPRVIRGGLPARSPGLDSLTATSRPSRAQGSPWRVGFVGSLIPSKGVHLLVEAWKRLPVGRFELELHGPAPSYHGDASYLKRLREQLGAEQAEHVLRGEFPPERLPEVLAGLDLLVIPSLWDESGPRVLDEAFEAGVPPVVSGFGRLREAVRDGVDGLHFARGDAADLARALSRFDSDSGLAERLSAAAPPAPRLEQTVEALEAAYGEARDRFRRRCGRVGVVVLDHRQPELAAAAAASVSRSVSGSDPLSPRILVVQNGPGPQIPLPVDVGRLALPENRGYAGGMNAGARALFAAGCDRVLLLNNDALLVAGALRALAEELEDEAVAAAGPIVVGFDGRMESAGLTVGKALWRVRLRGCGQGLAGAAQRARACQLASDDPDALSGVALLLSRKAFDQVGPLEESYFHGFEDVDWSLRARSAGFLLRLASIARCRHQGSATLGRASAQRLRYAMRNHLRAAARLAPLGRPGSSLRSLTALALGLAHALRQNEVPRPAAVVATLRGALDARLGRRGPLGA